MSTAAAEDTFLRSICLEVFSEPVSTPCGHNFCKRCIGQAWDTDGSCTCPLCKEVFHSRPQLRVNTFISGMVSEFKLEAEVNLKQESKPVVQCDFCSEPKMKALKSCLVCLSSFCETHLQPHLTVSGLKTHQLMEPVENLEDRMCPAHRRPLELFCGTDQQSCVCTTCVLLEHKNHELVSLEEAYERRRSSLLYTQAQRQHMVDQRRLKVQEIQCCLELSQRKGHREATEMAKAFTAIMESVQKCLDRYTTAIQQTQTKHKKQAEVFIQQLEQEICELEKRSSEAERLSHDPIHFLQHWPALTPPAGLKEWSSVSFKPETCEGSAARALTELEKRVSDEFRQLALESKKAEFRRVQQFAVDITLDSDTANPNLVLSKDLKQVCYSNVKKMLPQSPQRFDYCVNVLGKQSFSSGRFYFEVQVKGKTDWDLGVAQESINRKRKITASPKHGQWSIWLRNGNEYVALACPNVPLSLQRAPQKVGVFVDYGAGLVFFYDVDSADLLYSFSGCCFRGKLLPFLSPCLNDRGINSAPLIITAVQTQV
ncbi:E3 ubiquitin-protein ligase TRIM21-like [Eucyclogobius newberryi]|uniref:E3 ubiquitin-protein ligase TRIM21-like n=1 Tax=Eucyclogobius newberryi TaxID=166745 RepID=UPI003B59CCAB